MIRISKEAVEKINQCKEEYINHHPDAKSFRISHDRIIRQITEYYLN